MHNLRAILSIVGITSCLASPLEAVRSTTSLSNYHATDAIALSNRIRQTTFSEWVVIQWSAVSCGGGIRFSAGGAEVSNCTNLQGLLAFQFEGFGFNMTTFSGSDCGGSTLDVISSQTSTCFSNVPGAPIASSFIIELA